MPILVPPLSDAQAEHCAQSRQRVQLKLAQWDLIKNDDTPGIPKLDGSMQACLLHGFDRLLEEFRKATVEPALKRHSRRHHMAAAMLLHDVSVHPQLQDYLADRFPDKPKPYRDKLALRCAFDLCGGIIGAAIATAKQLQWIAPERYDIIEQSMANDMAQKLNGRHR